MAGLTDILFGHAAFQYLNAGCQLGVFDALYTQPGQPFEELMARLALSCRSMTALMFGLKSLGLVTERADRYSNASAVNALYEDGAWDTFCSTVLFEAEIVYSGQADFVQSLRAGCNVGLRRIPGAGPDLYHKLEQDSRLATIFFDYMGAWSRFSSPLLINNVDFTQVHSLLDVGGGDGTISLALAGCFSHLHITTVDLPEAAAQIETRSHKLGFSDRVRAQYLDILKAEFPQGHDCILFAHELVIWGMDVVEQLIRKAHAALPSGGSIVIFSSMSENDYSGPKMSALDSVYFVSIPAEGGLIHRWIDYETVLTQVGFVNITKTRSTSWTPHGVIQAWKAA